LNSKGRKNGNGMKPVERLCVHDIRITKSGNEFCQKCWSEFPAGTHQVREEEIIEQ
jgi:hypothetical protein